jgi:hypothetical protein
MVGSGKGAVIQWVLLRPGKGMPVDAAEISRVR